MQIFSYHLTHLAHGVYDLLAPHPDFALSLPDVLNILNYQREFYEQSVSMGRSSSSLQLFQFVRINAGMDGFTYSTLQIEQVLATEAHILHELSCEEELS